MGLARIAIAVLAVTLALGLVIVGGISLWGALTKDASKTASSVPEPSSSAVTPTDAGRSKRSAPSAQSGNEIDVQCLVAQCQIYVAGPTATDVIAHGALSRGERRRYTGTRLILQVDDASTVSVVINGQQQPKGRRGQQRTYHAPARSR
ncbi:hypothetical protein NE235_17710 [Actinoallomurus spadix]|uniref:DUF4115 domain-containing protein n=1 Tax=Actinoallomurus spadix TaxID=79912 RepID=A0ABN0XA84_9ACTN|nr:hypothetical protein [Actinoallomurus spadix]MCO5987941.1 hypothetical protein [Actinoallomurus spadix]